MLQEVHPARLLLLGYLITISLGFLLFLLPWCWKPGQQPGLVDTLFLATSAVCVTGLITVPISEALSPLGWAVLLVLIQVGGFGYMSTVTLIYLLLRQRIHRSQRDLLAMDLHLNSLKGIVRFFRRVALYILVVELLGTLALYPVARAEAPPGAALFSAFFHTLSAFNNAGFSLYPDSLARWGGHPWAVFVITSLIIAGGLGYVAVLELFWLRAQRPSVHTRFVLTMTALLLLVGFLFFWLLEAQNPRTLAGEPPGRQALLAWFQVVTTRTAGLSTLDWSQVRDATAWMMMLWMLIGGSPGGTAGGIKTTVAGLCFLSLWRFVRGDPEVYLFGRTIPPETVLRAWVVLLSALLLIGGTTTVLLAITPFSLREVLFETVSAFGTVGLSLGSQPGVSLAAEFPAPAKILLLGLMIMGRVGAVSVGIALLRPRRLRRARPPEERVLL